MICPVIKLVAYGDRNPDFIFVAIPNERARYLRTDPSVIKVPCPFCKSCVGEPCKGENGNYHTTTHYMRRDAAKKMRGKPVKPHYHGEDLIEEGKP